MKNYENDSSIFTAEGTDISTEQYSSVDVSWGYWLSVDNNNTTGAITFNRLTTKGEDTGLFCIATITMDGEKIFSGESTTVLSKTNTKLTYQINLPKALNGTIKIKVVCTNYSGVSGEDSITFIAAADKNFKVFYKDGANGWVQCSAIYAKNTEGNWQEVKGINKANT